MVIETPPARPLSGSPLVLSTVKLLVRSSSLSLTVWGRSEILLPSPPFPSPLRIKDEKISRGDGPIACEDWFHKPSLPLDHQNRKLQGCQLLIFATEVLKRQKERLLSNMHARSHRRHTLQFCTFPALPQPPPAAQSPSMLLFSSR